MPSLNKEENKRNISDLELLLLIEMGFFSNLKKTKLKFNLRPFSEPKHLQVEPIDWSFDTGFLNRLKQMKIRFNQRPTSEPSSNDTVKTSDEHVVDLHLEIVKKIDELLESREREAQLREFEPVTQIQQQLPLQEFVEFREVSVRKPEISQFSTDVQPGDVFREVNQEEEFFEIVPPTETHSNEQNQQVNDDFHSTMIREVQKSHKLFMEASHVKIKTKSSPQKVTKTEKSQKKLNGFTKKQIELEKTKQEIETRKIALKEAKEKEKAKEKELKKAKEEKLEREKLKKIELKKKLIEEKLKERKAKKAERLKQIELRKLEKGKLLKEKQKEKLEEEKRKEKFTLFSKKKQKKKKTEEIPKEQPVEEVEEKPLEIDELIKEKATTDQKPVLDDDVEKLLPILDELLEDLPEDVIDEFAHSDKFTLYEKVMRKYQNK